MHESIIQIRYNWFVELVRDWFNLPIDLFFSEENLQVNRKQGKQLLPLQNLDRVTSEQKRFFTNTLSLHNVDGSDFNFPVIQPETMAIIKNNVKAKVEHWHQHYARIHLKEFELALAAIKIFLVPTEYIKRSHLSVFLAENPQPATPSFRYHDLLSEQQNLLINAISAFYADPKTHVDQSNEGYIQQQITMHQGILQGLNRAQQKACVINDDNNLVIAGAGTGKTKTMVHRAQYVIAAGLAKPEALLLIAYGKDAAKEMADRIMVQISQPLSVSTFHALGKHIVSQVEKRQRHVFHLATDEIQRKKFIDNAFEEKLADKGEYRERVLQYFDQFLFPYKNRFEFKSLGEYYDYVRNNEIRPFSGETMRSYEECFIANFLFRNGIRYEYERRYPFASLSIEFKPYQPDFYLPDYDIYIEHFGVNENEQAPQYMDPQKYRQGMLWKRAQHKEHGTTLIETFSYERANKTLITNLTENLKAHGVTFNPISPDAYLHELRELGAINKFSDLMNEMLKVVKTSDLTEAEMSKKAQLRADFDIVEAAIELFRPLGAAYDAELLADEAIDFDEMINRAVLYVESGKFISPFSHIMVDEYQDISSPRARLVKALKEQNKNNVLFGVGDDWQAIYRFTGSDLSYTIGFFDYFGDGVQIELDTTYRFNDRLCHTASTFVMKNKHQIVKNLKTINKVENPSVVLVKTIQNEQESQVHQVLMRIATECQSQTASVFLISRFGFGKPNYLDKLNQIYPNLNIKFWTAHKSKGKEADFVIVLDMKKGKHGFPSEKASHPIIEALLPAQDDYLYSEERRLFYVAMTRAKCMVFVMTEVEQPSSFAKELLGKEYDVSTKLIAPSRSVSNVLNDPCPQCQTGLLMRRRSEHGIFTGCSYYPYCDYTIKACKCGSVRVEQGGYYICTSAICGWSDPICPTCHSSLVIREKSNKFWGCQRFPACRYTSQLREWNVREARVLEAGGR